MIQKILPVMIFALCSSVAMSADLPDSSQLPRMPDAYRNNDYKDSSKRNPYGMSVYDVAEQNAAEDIFGSEVISLEESRRILEERKKQQGIEKLNQGGTQ